ncbi:PLP-dependent aminotransferase family protein [Pandoraea nosoerga]|uniref:GntR family transcriptional regulator n=1 Tax=Pandoraea nosoerga TaxID=2508296 RepID=A0A5E4Y181_9BURK|nr:MULTISPECIES: PLP-dependent aminotransferase family protein [Pandoraea]MBN4667952.1 PLP-dependent aminotransferase family protein [Pandoraea nosoerga]MBN4677824.1 PLP-dependent aminotransferase family protein [Pandoraea nosoerga]MBN4682963.1 PLP-dependent aminotransferase family protein [Pandoraea nosoerga]MBN4746978.1 PLP-dependent aminotransferase family protein [Pandoraea nosoerga]VVE42396.1 GntR family transcriptional regulator [Pandoraea nosoerga]
MDAFHDTLRATFWKPALATGKGPRYLRLASFIEQSVADGRLRPGDRLPAQRELASWLGIDFTTVTRAYNRARERHAIEGRGPLGTFVSTPRVALDQVLDLGMNIPPAPADIFLGELLRQGVDEVLRHTDASRLMAYQLGDGGMADRQAGALWLAPMLGSIEPSEILVCPGAQATLAALLLADTARDDTVLCEPIVYPGLRSAARTLGRHLEAVATDGEGMLPDALAARAREHGARLVYLNPTLQNPTTRTMPEQRRRELLELAETLDLTFIEDDPYWRLARNAPPPLARLAPHRVHYVATLSKCLTPGLRTAYVRLADASRRDAFLTALRAFALMAPPLMTGLATQWIHNGMAERILAGVSAAAAQRQAIAAGILGGGRIAKEAKQTRETKGTNEAIAQGIHLWQPLPAPWTARELTMAARAEGLAVTPADAFCLAPDAPNAIRISLGGVKEPERLASGLRRLASLLREAPPSLRGAVV